MGTVIYESKDGRIQLKRFYGGKERGVCYQLSNWAKCDSYVQISETQLLELLTELVQRGLIRR